MAKSGVLVLSSGANESLNVCFCAVGDLLDGNNGTSPTVTGTELSLVARFTSTLPDLFMEAPSVVSVGAVQVSVTESPLRCAVRSVTALGILSDGGCGAPGLAQPAQSRAKTKIRRRARMI